MIVKLKPACKSYLWGGTNLNKQWNKSGDVSIAETWELSLHKDGLCVIDSGKHRGKYLADVATAKDFGKNCANFKVFPVLNKFIDAAEPLSVQVHPGDTFALANEGQLGKTEMWYILSAEEGSFIYLGFNRDMTTSLLSEAIESGTICDYLNKIPVCAGQTYMIPSGTVHSIGAGVTLFEIQQNSALTYRVFDYNRRDKDGKLRELHVDKAVAVSNLQKFDVPEPMRGELLGKCDYFAVYRYQGERSIGKNNSFVSLTVICGDVTVDNLALHKGDTAFISAGENAKVTGDGCYIVTCVE